MKATLKGLIALAALFLLSFSARAQSAGTWSATEQKNDKLQMSIRFGTSQHGNWLPLEDLAGLDRNQIRAANSQVEFRLVREAGTVTFKGAFTNGSGAGQFTFEEDPAFLSRLEAAGVRTTDRNGQPAGGAKLLSLALLDVSSKLARDLQSLGYTEISLSDLMAARIHAATPEFIREMRAAGYEITLDEAVAFRIHGVSPEFAREVRAEGIKASGDDLVAMRIHGAGIEWIRELRSLGHRDDDVGELVAMRIHGVSPEFVREIAALGYKDVSSGDLVAMRIHGVTPDFIRRAQAGGSSPTIRQLISMRIHGIEASGGARRR